MIKSEVQDALTREPFVPLRLHLRDGRRINVPFREVAHLLGYGVLVLIGLKKGTHQAKAYDRFEFDDIVRIERRPGAGGGRRNKKAS